MSKLWKRILATFNTIGEFSGCHQIPNRCIKIKNYTFPICARCTGVTIGQIIALILLLFNIKIPFYMSIIFLLIMGFDWFIQFIDILESNNKRRLLTGILGGYSVITIYYYIIRYILQLFNIHI